MKLLDRTHGKHAHERALDAGDHELLEQLEVPDDLSGLHKVPSIGEDGHEPVTERRRATPMVRWLGWVSIYLLAMAGLIAGLAMLSSDGDTDPVAPGVEQPDWDNEGPGSPTLLIPAEAEVGWASEFEGPGGYSQSQASVILVEPDAVTTVRDWSQTSGPGSNSLGPTPSPVPWSFETGGPGSNSLGVN